MTREQAIRILKSKMDGNVDTSYEWAEAVRMAIEALKQQPIIHCEECKHHGTSNCPMWGDDTTEDYMWCCDGERREGDEE